MAGGEYRKEIINDNVNSTKEQYKAIGRGITTGTLGLGRGIVSGLKGVGHVLGDAYRLGPNLAVGVVIAGAYTAVKGVYRRAQAVAATISEVDKALQTYRDIRTDQKDGYDVPGLRSYLHRGNASAESFVESENGRDENAGSLGIPRHEHVDGPPAPPHGKTVVREVDHRQNDDRHDSGPLNENGNGQQSPPSEEIIETVVEPRTDNSRRDAEQYNDGSSRRHEESNPPAVSKKSRGEYGSNFSNASSDDVVASDDDFSANGSKKSTAPTTLDLEADDYDRELTFSSNNAARNQKWPKSCGKKEIKMWTDQGYKVVPNTHGQQAGTTFKHGNVETHHDSGSTITVYNDHEDTFRDVLKVVNERNNNEGINLGKINGSTEFLEKCVKAALKNDIRVNPPGKETEQKYHDIYNRAYLAARPSSPRPSSPPRVPAPPMPAPILRPLTPTVNKQSTVTAKSTLESLNASLYVPGRTQTQNGKSHGGRTG